MALRKTGSRGIALIKSFESRKLAAYRCPAGILTIGYGHTGADVHAGMTITDAQANALLQKDLNRFEAIVSAAIHTATQAQFDALVSFTFNVGGDDLRGSTLLKKHNAGDYARAKAEFARWNHADGMVLPGLTRRRAAEAALYGAAA